MVNNLNDGLAWGLFPLFFAAAGLSVARIGVLAALYPAVWGLGQLVTGGLSDRIGRKWLIAGGMLTQAVAIGLIAATTGFGLWALGAVLLGAGTAMVYPTLLAAIGDVAHPSWRARSVGVYRLWRDGGFAVGALLAGIIADLFGMRAAIWAVAALTAASGVVVARAHVRDPPSDAVTTLDPSTTDRTRSRNMTETQGLPVDVESLRAQVREKYRAVAVAPERRVPLPHRPSPRRQTRLRPRRRRRAPRRRRRVVRRRRQPVLDPRHSNPASGSSTSVRAPGSTRSSPRTPSTPTGAVVGVDMTPEMLTKSRATAKQLGLTHVEFREGYAEALPVEDSWADVVISNGVINLCADKQAVFAEIRRVLRPGGVLQFADIANGRPVPPEALRDIDLWTG